MAKNINTYILFGSLLMLAMGTGCKKDNGSGHAGGSPMTISSFTPTSGGGGTEVLITGVNFTGDTNQVSVTLNGEVMKVVGVNGSQIMVMVPKKVGSGHIKVTIGNDTTLSDGIFNYVYTRTVSTFAGSGKAGFANGNGTDAMFDFSSQSWYRSMGLAVDDNLNLYVADAGNHCIRKIDSLGNVTTFCGNPNSSGYADGKGTAAKFSLPYDVSLDAGGNVWCVDPGNWDIRKISPDGTATTWAWGNQAPWSVSVDKTTGTVYYTSCSSPGNVYPVTAQWTTGSPIVSGINYPACIRFDKSGNMFLSNNGDNVIQKFTHGTWAASTIAGQTGMAGYVNGVGTAAKFDHNWGIGLDASGNIYVAGNGTWDGGTYNTDQAIRFIDGNTYTVSTFAGSGSAGYVDAVGEAAAFSAPTGVAIDKNGTVYVMDKNNNRIRKIISE